MLRVPVANGSLTDITCIVKNEINVNELNQIFKNVSKSNLSGILYYSEDPLVSVDILSSPYSCIFDSKLTYCLGNMIKIVGWYDNEFGYSSRLLDLINIIFKK